MVDTRPNKPETCDHPLTAASSGRMLCLRLAEVSGEDCELQVCPSADIIDRCRFLSEFSNIRPSFRVSLSEREAIHDPHV